MILLALNLCSKTPTQAPSSPIRPTTPMPSSTNSRSRGRPRSFPNRKDQRECDFALYCERNLIERFFNKIKHFRGIATRYDKLARNYLAAVQLVAAIILIN